MQLQEYRALQKVEREHWFYRGKRALVQWWIAQLLPRLSHSDVIIDAGAGTGELVAELRRELPTAQVTGIEFVDEARNIAKELTGVSLEAGSILDLPIASATATVAIALDVLEHVEDDALALAELIRITKPGGLVIVNVPASMLLWSEWDVTLGHFRRYSMGGFRALLQPHLKAERVTLEYCGYINVVLFPAVLAYRQLSRVIAPANRAEDKIPAPWLNSMLFASFVGPAKWKWFHAPFGVSIFCVLRKQ